MRLRSGRREIVNRASIDDYEAGVPEVHEVTAGSSQ